MKKTILAVATSAALAGPLHATAQQTLDSTGQVLLYPFYSTQNGSNTLMHVVNNTNEQKAIKLRFMEGQGSSVVLEFNVYLDAYDIFPVALAANSFGGTSVLTTDATCTVPALGTPNNPYNGEQTELADGSILRSQPFVPYQYENEESGDISRTLIGHAEAIEMGVVDDAVDVSDCFEMSALWTSGDWASNTSTNVTAPTGGLSGSSVFINPDLAFSMDLSVVAVDGWADPALGYHAEPGTLFPNLTQGVKTAVVDGVTFDYTSQSNGSVLALSALLTATAIYNEVQTEDALAAETDWVLTFPTKKYLDGQAPFTNAYDTEEANGGACESLEVVRRDRESGSSNGSGGFVPSDGGSDQEFCNNVQVISFNSKSALVTDTADSVSYPFQSGAAEFTASQTMPADDNGEALVGLPVIGFSATRIVNGPMSYGYAQDHKTSVISSGS